MQSTCYAELRPLLNHERLEVLSTLEIREGLVRQRVRVDGFRTGDSGAPCRHPCCPLPSCFVLPHNRWMGWLVRGIRAHNEAAFGWKKRWMVVLRLAGS